ncbi:uncharacterized protein A4U43_C07F30520 [Asparagus officinalis]|uniref:Uncharacterized protein n=1 Tax=Asparagus officinalis TaxID=4686 RepID=A0A5P1EJ72_ASPOF|nr:uncharacterized protein A4U43_C07F30520 [Asparagus officinalis]
MRSSGEGNRWRGVRGGGGDHFVVAPLSTRTDVNKRETSASDFVVAPLSPRDAHPDSSRACKPRARRQDPAIANTQLDLMNKKIHMLDLMNEKEKKERCCYNFYIKREKRRRSRGRRDAPVGGVGEKEEREVGWVDGEAEAVEGEGELGRGDEAVGVAVEEVKDAVEAELVGGGDSETEGGGFS